MNTEGAMALWLPEIARLVSAAHQMARRNSIVELDQLQMLNDLLELRLDIASTAQTLPRMLEHPPPDRLHNVYLAHACPPSPPMANTPPPMPVTPPSASSHASAYGIDDLFAPWPPPDGNATI